jgi:pimeloyl-ACP methyl ester carboxylesterase
MSAPGGLPPLREVIRRHGLAARRSLGQHFPAEGVEWWIRFMGRTAVSSRAGFIPAVADTDISGALPKIRCPTLVITTEGSGLASVEETRAWQRLIPRSELLVLPGDSYHVAASDAEACAAATLDFIGRVFQG